MLLLQKVFPVLLHHSFYRPSVKIRTDEKDSVITTTISEYNKWAVQKEMLLVKKKKGQIKNNILETLLKDSLFDDIYFPCCLEPRHFKGAGIGFLISFKKDFNAKDSTEILKVIRKMEPYQIQTKYLLTSHSIEVVMPLNTGYKICDVADKIKNDKTISKYIESVDVNYLTFRRRWD